VSYGCHNRNPFSQTVMVQDGYTSGGSHRIDHVIEIPFRMAINCQYTKTDLGKVDKYCQGCKHNEGNEMKNQTEGGAK
jgi:hypothetical protein